MLVLKKNASINFTRALSKDYELVQRNIYGLITRNLSQDQYTYSRNTPRKGKINMTLFIREPGDVIMSHGVADKNYFLMRHKNGSMLANSFKHIFVPGPWMKRKLLEKNDLNFSEENIHIVGWPRIEFLNELKRKIWSDESVRILWAPTHDGRRRGADKVSTSTYPGFLEDAEKLKKNYSFEESLHPHNKLIKTVTGQQLVDCDVVISDFGTMVYEAWALNKPVIFPRWILKDYIQEFLPGSAEAFIMENRIGFHPDSYDEMVDMINSGLKLTDDVNEFMEDYLPSELYSSSGKKIAETLLRLAEKTS
ncbi:hypothetical protein [Spirochaeta isovalerica]|uniref:hypothetical protein n=1 Tax=Spirochaeta isovalerica TaxID=150 RepID=UPI001609781B|nr:hypothetical protein [Spirochaeta isovalerica]